MFALNCDKSFWNNSVKFYIFENVLHNVKDYFWQFNGVSKGNSFSSAFVNIFLFYNETKLINYNIIFFRYIDDIIVFNCDNFESISLSIYPKEIVKKIPILLVLLFF